MQALDRSAADAHEGQGGGKKPDEGGRLEPCKSTPDLILSCLNRLEVVATDATMVVGLPTGFHPLDRLTTGMQEGDLVVVAGATSVGKSAFALNVARHVALEEGLPVLWFSLEMDGEQWMDRLTSLSAQVPLRALRTGLGLDSDAMQRFVAFVESLPEAKLLVDDRPALSISDIRERAAQEAKAQGRLGMIVVDYLQLMAGTSERESSRANEISEITRGLKSLARQLRCPVVVLSQISRGFMSRPGRRPALDDLRDSGAIAEDADIVMFIHREDYFGATSNAGIAEIIVAKQRSDVTGTICLAFDKACLRFDAVAD